VTALPLALLLALGACSSAHDRYVKAPAEGEDPNVIVLVNPYQDAIDKELKDYQKLGAHTVYDSETKIAGAKDKFTNDLLEKMSGNYEFTTVHPGENLGNVSQRLYGTTTLWKQLFAWNQDQLLAPNRVKKGMRLKYLPNAYELVPETKATVAQQAPAATPARRAPASAQNFKSYTVKPNQNLGSIAERLLGDRKAWRKLRDWNRDTLPDPNNLEAGTVLRYIAP